MLGIGGYPRAGSRDAAKGSARLSRMRALAKLPGWVIGVGIGVLVLVGIGAAALWSSSEESPAPDEPKEKEKKTEKKARARKSAPKRKVFFSFHYQRDIWRVNQIRNAGVIDASAAAGWADEDLGAQGYGLFPSDPRVT